MSDGGLILVPSYTQFKSKDLEFMLPRGVGVNELRVCARSSRVTKPIESMDLQLKNGGDILLEKSFEANSFRPEAIRTCATENGLLFLTDKDECPIGKETHVDQEPFCTPNLLTETQRLSRLCWDYKLTATSQMASGLKNSDMKVFLVLGQDISGKDETGACLIQN